MMVRMKKVRKIVILVVLALGLSIFTIGCVEITGEVEVDWRARGEIGVKVLFNQSLYQWAKPLVTEQLLALEDVRVEEVKEQNKEGFRIIRPLHDLKRYSKTKETFHIPRVGSFEVHTQDYWLFKIIHIETRLDLQTIKIPGLVSSFIKPAVEVKLPISTKNNADQVKDKGKHLIWTLSLGEPNLLWVRIVAPNVLNIGIVLALILGTVLFIMIKKRRKKGIFS